MEMDRALATVETVEDIRPIPDADRIEVARVRGWDVVVQKGTFAVGDEAVYIEIDSMLDVTQPRFLHLENKGVRSDVEGNKGHVLKTIRLRGQYSQGLLLRLEDVPEVIAGDFSVPLAEAMGIRKWEPPIPAQISGEIKGPMPGWIHKTDEERVQNMPPDIFSEEGWWTCTEKIDGTSATFYAAEGKFGVCGRNWEFKENGNTFWQIADALYLREFLIEQEQNFGPVYVQGELFGEGIQGNPLKIKGQRLCVFTYNIGGQRVPRPEWPSFLADLSAPVLDLPFPAGVEEALAQVENLKSAISPDRPAEGVVWRRGHQSFKVVSNRYLLKHDL